MSEKTRVFWEAKKLATEKLLDVYDDADTPTEKLNDQARARREAFLKDAADAWLRVRDVLTELNQAILGPYVLGEPPHLSTETLTLSVRESVRRPAVPRRPAPRRVACAGRQPRGRDARGRRRERGWEARGARRGRVRARKGLLRRGGAPARRLARCGPGVEGPPEPARGFLGRGEGAAELQEGVQGWTALRRGGGGVVVMMEGM